MDPQDQTQEWRRQTLDWLRSQDFAALETWQLSRLAAWLEAADQDLGPHGRAMVCLTTATAAIGGALDVLPSDPQDLAQQGDRRYLERLAHYLQECWDRQEQLYCQQDRQDPQSQSEE